MATTTPTVQQKQVLGAALFELLMGNLTDETIAAVDQIKRDEVPEVFHEIVGFMHGMSTTPQMRPHVTAHLLAELGGTYYELAEKLSKSAPPIVY